MKLPSAPEPTIDFTRDTDEDLLGYMALRGEEEQVAQEAFAEFFERHARWLYTTVRQCRLGPLVGADGAQDVVQETFRRAYLGAATFDGGDVIDSADLQRRARAWLGGIGNRVAADLLSSDRLARNAESLTAVPEGIANRGVRAAETGQVRVVLENLSERERDVVLTWLLHYKFDGTCQRLPNQASAALADRWGTTPENIRQIRHRALEKLRKELALEGTAER